MEWLHFLSMVIQFLIKDQLIYQEFQEIIFDNWVFENLISTDGLLANALQILEPCLFVSNNWCGKLVLSLEDNVRR